MTDQVLSRFSASLIRYYVTCILSVVEGRIEPCNLTNTMSNAVIRASKLINRFKTRELSREPISYAQINKTDSIPRYSNPFLPSIKDPAKKSRVGPRYSLRRQKELIKAAQLLASTPVEENGDPNALAILPPSPKSLSRVTGGGVDRALKELGKEQATVTVKEKTTSIGNNLLSPQEKGVIWLGKPSPRNELGIYEGRKFAFKRHIWERDQPDRQEATKRQLSGMDRRVTEWRQVRFISAQPNMPYFDTNSKRRTGKTAGSKLPF